MGEDVKFEKCIDNRKLIKEEFSSSIIANEMDAAESDLRSAKFSLNNKNYKWATVQAYYSMFRAARALLFSRGYREKSHSCCIVALQELFEKELDLKYITHLREAKRLRESADYGFDFSEFGAKDCIENATEFISKAKKILDL